MNGDRFLVDTNVLVYAYDRSEPAKQLRSRQILKWLVTVRAGVLTTQVLAEFFSAVFHPNATAAFDEARATPRVGARKYSPGLAQNRFFSGKNAM